ncbi:anaerobic magnesium-protoporphyrin IX monomethyl ester cyclase [Candidatus Magnetomoraceae bacterium gMMP-1]
MIDPVKVILFNPPHPEGKGFTREGRCTQEAGIWATQWPPVSLAATAALLERDGHILKVIDCPAIGMDETILTALLKKFQPDFVFWNTATPTLNYDLNLANLIKKTAPNSITGVSGTHVTALPEIALNNPDIDLVIKREPEETIREICVHKKKDWDNIPGISFKKHETGKIYHNKNRSFIPPEQIPFPAWQYLDLSPYRLPLKGRPFLIVAPIRGCPFSCNFCTAPIYYGKRLRKRPVKNVVDEIEYNIKRFRINDFFIWADTFTADKDYVRQFCKEILVRGLRISWTCNSRVDRVDRELLVIMKKAGLWMISFGLESGNNDILKKTGKKITVKQSKTAVILAHQAGIKISGHFILGLPGETKKTMKQTLDFALNIPLDIAQFYAAAPFPGTMLYSEVLEKGWLKNSSIGSQNHSVMNLPGLSAAQVDAFRSHAYRRFYMRPKILFKLLSILEPAAFKNIGISLRRFFS